MRTVWFHREYTRLRGGHLKHSHYYGHVARTPGFQPRITFTGEAPTGALAAERGELWPPGVEGIAGRWAPEPGDVLFLAGVDWRYLHGEGLARLPNPRINLVQHVRHAHEGTELYGYLAHRAVRICVSQEVAESITATGRVNGPVLAIPNGVETLSMPVCAGAPEPERIPVLIAGYKEPGLARALAERLSAMGIDHLLLTEFRARRDYLNLLARSRVAVCLPRAEEGFYLPALEAMGLGCILVTLDCIGNRGFCRNGENCLIAEPGADSLAKVAAEALRLPAERRSVLLREAAATASAHTLDAERERFQAVLGEIDRVWASG